MTKMLGLAGAESPETGRPASAVLPMRRRNSLRVSLESKVGVVFCFAIESSTHQQSAARRGVLGSETIQVPTQAFEYTVAEFGSVLPRASIDFEVLGIKGPA